jgi:cyanophycinase
MATVNHGDTGGSIALAGGNEFRSNCVTMDKMLLARLKRSPDRPPRVVIIPTAAVKGNPRMAADNGVRHFNALGAFASAALVISRADADSVRYSDQIKDADMVYLAGGDPPYLRDTLRGSTVWAAVRAVYERGGIIAGSSAGAMVLAAKMRAYGMSGDWIEALNVVPNIVVFPHHRPASQESIQAMQRAVGGSLFMLGIDEATACLSDNGNMNHWIVSGAGTVTVYARDGVQVFSDGQRFSLK